MQRVLSSSRSRRLQAFVPPFRFATTTRLLDTRRRPSTTPRRLTASPGLAEWHRAASSCGGLGQPQRKHLLAEIRQPCLFCVVVPPAGRIS